MNHHISCSLFAGGQSAPEVHPEMIVIPGGRFRMGSVSHYLEEAPSHDVRVGGFLIDKFPVTNRQFKAFVRETGYVTVAERTRDARGYPGALPEMLYAGSLVFRKPCGPIDPSNWEQWWTFVAGADWRHPIGSGSGLFKKDNHPVVHVAYEDAMAYAAWVGKDLPTEAEWEYAASGGLEGTKFAWGDESPNGKQMANAWQGDFRHQNLLTDDYEWTSPVNAFPPNGYGLCDMIGNIWEWTSDWWSSSYLKDEAKGCCISINPRGGPELDSHDPLQPAIPIPRKVLKGGSHLCASNYCKRYRPAARHAEPVDTSASHIGFRCVLRSRHGHGGRSHQ